MEPVKDGTKTLGEIVEGILENVPVYDDAIQPTAQALGRGFGGLVLWVMQPFIKMGLVAESNLSQFKSETDSKLSRIPENNLITPDPVIAGPILQSLGYTVHHKHLRDMFINLLATASDDRMSSLAHPSYVEIIKQLSPEESLVIKYISSGESGEYPIINLNLRTEKGYIYVLSEYNLLPVKSGCADNRKYKEIIENLERLKLITVDAGENAMRIDEDSQYDELARKAMEESGIPNIVFGEPTSFEVGTYFFTMGVLQVTAFGKQFLKTCVQ